MYWVGTLLVLLNPQQCPGTHAAWLEQVPGGAGHAEEEEEQQEEEEEAV